MTAPRLYSSTDICTATGITYRRLDYMVRQQVLGGEINRRGSGVSRRFNEHDLAVIRVVAALADIGAGMEVLTKVGDFLRAAGLPVVGVLTVSADGSCSLDGTSTSAAVWTVDLVRLLPTPAEVELEDATA